MACARPLASGDSLLCGGCLEGLGPQPATVELDEGELAFTVHPLLRHAGAARELVHALKYQGRGDVARFLARRAASSRALTPPLTLVPVPLHPRRERARGYNQSELLARALAECLPGLTVDLALARRRPTRSQTRLDRAARAANVAGVFALVDRQAVAGRRVLLVDDVVTTGATLVAAAGALRPGEPLALAALAAALADA